MRLVVAGKPETTPELRREHIALSTAWPRYAEDDEKRGPVVICAAGPSLLADIPLIKALYDMGVPVCAVKGVADILQEHGIIPTYAVFHDPKENQLAYLKNPNPKTLYYLSSQVHPALYAKAHGAGCRIEVWHGSTPDYFADGDFDITEGPNAGKRGILVIGGGCTTGLRAINLMRSHGHDDLHLFGFDCSSENGRTHTEGYEKKHYDTITVTVNGRTFQTHANIAAQHDQFFDQLVFITPRPNLTVYGTGTIAEGMKALGEYIQGDTMKAGKWWMEVDRPPEASIEITPEKLSAFHANPDSFFQPMQIDFSSFGEPVKTEPTTVGDFFKGKRSVAVPDVQMRAHVLSALGRKWPEHRWVRPHDKTLIICGGGPSMKDRATLNQIRRMVKKGGHLVCSVNGTHDHFLSLPKKHLGPVIESDITVLLDPKQRVKDYVHPVTGTLYFVASQCDPHTLDVFERPEIAKFLYHHADQQVMDLTEKAKNHTVPAFCSTVGLESILIGYRLGFRKFRLFGMESSYSTETKNGQVVPKDLHAYAKEKEYLDVLPVAAKNPKTGEEQTFLTNAHMACQAEDFKFLIPLWDGHVKQKHYEQILIVVHGDGLLPACARFLNLEYPWVIHADGLHQRLRSANQEQRLGRGRQRAVPRRVRAADHPGQWPAQDHRRLLHHHSGG